MLRLLGIPVSDDDARHLVATLIVEGTPDALTAAGGPTSRADLNPVNLAAPLVDAAQIYIPRLGEAPRSKVNRPLPGVNLPPASIDTRS